MEGANGNSNGTTTPRAVPPLLADVEVSNLPGFDVTPTPSPRPQPSPKKAPRPGVPPLDRVTRRSEVVLPPLESPFQAPGYRSVQPVSISLPASPSGFGAPAVPAVATGAGDPDGLRRQAMANAAAQPSPPPAQQDKEGGSVRFAHQPDKVVFRSQPIPGGQPAARPRAGRIGSRVMSRDKRYDSFKTFSGKLERQLTHLTGAPEAHDGEDDGEDDAITASRSTSMPKVDRFFAALEGPELDKLKSSEELVLPSDKKWPFLLRFPVSAFGICLGVSSQAILWKTIATSAPTTFL